MTAFVAISIVVLLFFLSQNKIKASFLFFGLVLIYYFLDLIKIDVMLRNFINKSLVVLLLLLTVSIVFEKTSFITRVSDVIFSRSFKWSLLKMSYMTSLFSAFLNNTAVVASMISIVTKNRYHAPSKLLLPLSFAAIFGGVTTLIGTSTNLIVNSFMIERGLEPLRLFDFVYVGVPIIIVGGFVLVFIARFLPEGEIEKNVENYFIEAKVLKNSKLAGKSIAKNKLRNLELLFLSEIVRDGHIISPVAPDEVICEDDILIFVGDIKEIDILKRFDKLLVGRHIDQKDLTKNLTEVIVSHQSNLVNKTIKQTNFRVKFDASVIAIKRGSEKLTGKIGEIKLQAGDILVLATGNDFHKRENIAQNFYLINNLGIQKKLTIPQSWMVVISFLFVILLSLFNILELVKGLFVLLVFYVLTGFLEPAEIKRRFPYELALIIGSALGIAKVMIDTGLANLISDFLLTLFGSFGIYGAFFAIYLLTFVLTQVITNNAAAALAFPIAYSAAVELGVNIIPFIMAVAYGASSSFLTPYGYQTNLMVSSVGGYSFNMFLKTGAIVTMLYSFLVSILIPIFFKF